MIQEFKQRQFPAGNPLANALVVIVGVLVIAVSFVLGVVALVALIAAAAVMAAVIGVRVWWFNRKLAKQGKDPVTQTGKSRTSAEIIEGEFRVVTLDKDHDSTQ